MATILAVDDEQPILELIKNGLQKDGHMVTGYVSCLLYTSPSPRD